MSGVPSAVQISSAVQTPSSFTSATNLTLTASSPVGSRVKTYALAGAPASMWGATSVTSAPVTLSDGVSAAKFLTGRLNATTTCVVSDPVWKVEVAALAGRLASRGPGSVRQRVGGDG